jgi:Zn-dependent protease
MGTTIYTATTWILPVLLAITLHEAAHGYAADRLGDDTARRAGRISLNPLRHVDAFGTILLPALLLLTRAPFLFGYAKPVPVSFWRLNHPRRDMVLVAAAGPGMNLLLALGAAFLYHGVEWLPARVAPWVAENLRNALLINVVLAVFNMLPLPPLDGGRVAVGLLPDALARPLSRLEPIGIFLVIGALFLLPGLGDMIGVDLNIFQWLVAVPAQWLLNLIATVAGITKA